jgi:hypothetical protein
MLTLIVPPLPLEYPVGPPRCWTRTLVAADVVLATKRYASRELAAPPIGQLFRESPWAEP